MRIVVIAALVIVMIATVGCNSDESTSTASTSVDVPKVGYPHAIEVQLGDVAADVTDSNCRVTSSESYPPVARCKIRIGDETRVFVKQNERWVEG